MNNLSMLADELSAQDLLAIAINKTEDEIYELETERRKMMERHRQELFQIEARIAKKRRQLVKAQEGELF